MQNMNSELPTVSEKKTTQPALTHFLGDLLISEANIGMYWLFRANPAKSGSGELKKGHRKIKNTNFHQKI